MNQVRGAPERACRPGPNEPGPDRAKGVRLRQGSAAPRGGRQAPPPQGAPVHARFVARRLALRAAATRRARRRLRSMAVALGLVALAIGLSVSPLFAIAAVQVQGVTGDRAEAVRTAAALGQGGNLLAADLDRAAEAVARLPWVLAVDVRRAPPSTVVVAVAAREPVAVLQSGPGTWLLDSQGVVIAGGASDGAVRIDLELATPPRVGAPVDPRGLAALAVHDALPSALRPRVITYFAQEVGELSLLVRHEGREVLVRFGAAADVADKATAIQALLDELTARGATDWDALELDVRAPRNPAVRQRVGSVN